MSDVRTRMCDHYGAIGEIGPGGKKPVGWWFRQPEREGDRIKFYCSLRCRRADDKASKR